MPENPDKPRFKPSSWQETIYARLYTHPSIYFGELKSVATSMCKVVPTRDVEDWVREVAVADPDIDGVGTFTIASLNVLLRGERRRMVSEERYDLHIYYPGGRMLEPASFEEFTELFPSEAHTTESLSILTRLWQSGAYKTAILSRNGRLMPASGFAPNMGSDIIVDL